MAVSERAVIDLCVGWFRNTVGNEGGLLTGSEGARKDGCNERELF